MKEKQKEMFGKGILFTLIWTFSLSINAQNIALKGTVTDIGGEPLTGVTVRVQGATTGTITDIDGKFSLLNVFPDTTFELSYVGLRMQTVALKGRTTILVVMEEDAELLEEVVSVGYRTLRRVNITQEVGVVDRKILQDKLITNFKEKLQGSIPNLQVYQGIFASGQVASFYILDYITLNGGVSLNMVNGVVHDPYMLNPIDVESVSVLMYAPLATIYGAFAAKGVVLITTKNGIRVQKPTLLSSSSYFVTNPSNIPKYTDYWEYFTYLNTASKNAGVSNIFDDRFMMYAKAYYDSAIDSDGKKKFAGNTDWAEELFWNDTLVQNNVRLSGGIEKIQYYAS